MQVLLYVVAAVFGFFSLGLISSFFRSKHLGLLLAAVIFGAAAVAAISLHSWWPLLAGFALAWVLRLTGADPGWR
jgi:hypothetical protein